MMEAFIKIKRGQILDEVESILDRELNLKEFRNNHTHYYFCHFEDIGVWLFFNTDDKSIYSIRYESPFSLEVEGIKIGFTKKQVKGILGDPHRKWPMPDDEVDRWLYDRPEFIRFDFEKTRNGKVLKIFK